MTNKSPWEWHITETFKGLITLCVETLKIIAIINGGAAVAVLTYAGNLAIRGIKVPGISSVLLFYCFGLTATMIAFLLAYAAQIKLYREERALHRGLHVVPTHGFIMLSVVLFLVASIIAFWSGCLLAAKLFGG